MEQRTHSHLHVGGRHKSEEACSLWSPASTSCYHYTIPHHLQPTSESVLMKPPLHRDPFQKLNSESHHLMSVSYRTRMALFLNIKVFLECLSVGSMSWLCSDWSVLMTNNRSGANLCEGFPSSLHPSSLLLTVTGGPARRRPHQHTGSSRRVSQNWPRNPSSRRRRHYSWCVIPGRCRSCSSGPSLLRSRGRIIACTGHWVSSGQTCRQCGSLLRCESWSTRWRLSHAMSTASRRAQRGAASIDCRCRHTWGCRWALGAGRPASRRSCWGTADSRTGNIARWWISGSSWKHSHRGKIKNQSNLLQSGGIAFEDQKRETTVKR